LVKVEVPLHNLQPVEGGLYLAEVKVPLQVFKNIYIPVSVVGL
jgi:hypothetical protein